jgi:hypothetical protein
MIARTRTLTFVALFSLPLIAAPHEKTAPEIADVFCGEVLSVDLFNQTFLIRDGTKDGTKAVDTVPFSRWTNFVTRATDGQGRRHVQALDPTDVRTGDRLCILLDPSGATADRIEVLPAHRSTQIARACAK